MQIKKVIRGAMFAIFSLVSGMLPISQSWAHGGVSVEIDTCRIPVGDAWVHFTGYTPTFSADTEYCNTIPNVGATNLVFDYEDPKLKKMTVEFEITKEPSGERVYYQAPKAHKTGTIDAQIDFSKPGAGEGKYLTHVTLVNDGKKIDAHLPFTVSSGGVASGVSFGMLMIFLGLMALAIFAYVISQKKAQKEAAAVG